MTDNRTTELREMLTERGVEWIDESNGFADVTTFIANGAKWTVISKSYLNPEHDWMTMNAERITPEQAIAATLGSEREAKLIRAMEDVLRHSTDTVWAGEAETLVDRMVSLGVYKHNVYEGIRPWEVD